MMIKLSFDGGTTQTYKYKEGVSPKFQTLPEGIRFYDEELDSMRFMHWDTIKSIEYTHDVTEKERIAARAHRVLKSDKRAVTGPITTKSFG